MVLKRYQRVRTSRGLTRQCHDGIKQAHRRQHHTQTLGTEHHGLCCLKPSTIVRIIFRQRTCKDYPTTVTAVSQLYLSQKQVSRFPRDNILGVITLTRSFSVPSPQRQAKNVESWTRFSKWKQPCADPRRVARTEEAPRPKQRQRDSLRLA